MSLKIFGSLHILEFQIDCVQPTLFLIIAPFVVFCRERKRYIMVSSGDLGDLKLAWFPWLKHGDYQPRFSSGPLSLSVGFFVLA